MAPYLLEMQPIHLHVIRWKILARDHHTNILQFPLVAPKDVLDGLSTPPPKDLDDMLLDSMKPTSTSKVQNGGSLPTFPWSHVSGFKANPDVVKSTPNKSSCRDT
ncbi:hypothetical protein CTI12_AA241530 [Artemisia annua]|uniref:Uncharacterized protein n=1 Tax=Artemisia annua TaxID=35608 RepID=A0A2U1NPQ3_ARTAN|nr:hypothetical protein CTI12_AA241530 [Artemisia annua]